MAFTPGPWKAVPRKGSWDWWTVRPEGKPDILASVYPDLDDNGYPKHDERANARLMAAAPEMLNYIAGFVAKVANAMTRDIQCPFCYAIDDDRHDEDCLYLQAVALLAKATGQGE